MNESQPVMKSDDEEGTERAKLQDLDLEGR